MKNRKRRAFIVLILSFLLFSLFMGKTLKDISAMSITEGNEPPSVEEEKSAPTDDKQQFPVLPKEVEKNGSYFDGQADNNIEGKSGAYKDEDTEDTSTRVEDIFIEDGKKTLYLTFDDGPSKNITPKILDVLKEYEVKATFFVIGSLAEQNQEIIKRTAKEGHAIGNHTYSHKYKDIYSSIESLLDEVHRSSQVISNILGESYKPTVFRFPGGSWGKKYSPFKEALKEHGYEYVEWNALNGDAEGHNIPKEELLKRMKETLGDQEDVVLLMHDAGAKKTTLEALPEAIEYLKSRGYTFKTLK